MPPLHHDHVLSNGCIQRCIQCDLLFNLPVLHKKQRAYCPRCRAKIAMGQDWSLNRLMVIVIAMLVLMPFAFCSPLISIRLLGTWIDASLFSGIWQISRQGDPFTASMVAFCTIGGPLILTFSLLYLTLGSRMGLNLRPVLLMLEQLKEWVMLDIYLIGIIVTCIKVNEYAEISAGVGLIAYLFLTLLTLLILIHLNFEQLWQRFYPQPSFSLGCYEMMQKLLVCHHCHYSGYPDQRQCCTRCHLHLQRRCHHCLQKTWSALIAAMLLLLPANLLPMSVVYANGMRIEDTLFSGVVSLASAGHFSIAAIVFIASVLLPLSKIIILLTLLLSIHLKTEHGLKTRIRLLRIITWIGRWSMLDLFVIALMMSLINRDQIIVFTMGPAAFYFGAAVILTILAVEWLDSRLIWDEHATGNTDCTD